MNPWPLDSFELLLIFLSETIVAWPNFTIVPDLLCFASINESSTVICIYESVLNETLDMAVALANAAPKSLESTLFDPGLNPTLDHFIFNKTFS